MPSDCPGCGQPFDSERGMKVHHAKAHGESLATYTRDCVVCGEEFTQYRSVVEDQRACSNGCKGVLISEAKSLGETETCRYCGATVDIEPWEREWKDYWFCDMDCKGEWMSENVKGENHPSWKGGWEHYYGSNWHEMREKARRRDEYACVVCGKEKEEIGTHPHVHHIRPVRGFEEKNEAHTLDNLVTLCPDHHWEAEAGDIEVRA